MMQRLLGQYPETLLQKFFERIANSNTFSMSEEYRHYAAREYPRNHTFTIANNTIHPTLRLASRYKKLKKLYPENLESIVDIGCSKGFFVFSANCERSLGIDINPYALHFCHWLKTQLSRRDVSFEKMHLHELAERIDEFGGAFQTVLVVNAYQYLYFGSENFRNCYRDHDVIFQYLRKICKNRIIFNNRIELSDCQNVDCIDYAESNARNYSEEKMLAAARRYFTVKKMGKIGKYPLFAMDVK